MVIKHVNRIECPIGSLSTIETILRWQERQKVVEEAINHCQAKHEIQC